MFVLIVLSDAGFVFCLSMHFFDKVHLTGPSVKAVCCHVENIHLVVLLSLVMRDLTGTHALASFVCSYSLVSAQTQSNPEILPQLECIQ